MAKQPWWQVTPQELAARFDGDSDRVHDAVGYPDNLPDWQLELVFAAVAVCEGEIVPPRKEGIFDDDQA